MDIGDPCRASNEVAKVRITRQTDTLSLLWRDWDYQDGIAYRYRVIVLMVVTSCPVASVRVTDRGNRCNYVEVTGGIMLYEIAGVYDSV